MGATSHPPTGASRSRRPPQDEAFVFAWADLHKSRAAGTAASRCTKPGVTIGGRCRTAGAAIALGQQVKSGPEHIIDALPPESWNPGTGERENQPDRRIGQ